QDNRGEFEPCGLHFSSEGNGQSDRRSCHLHTAKVVEGLSAAAWAASGPCAATRIQFSQGVHKIVNETKTTLNHENKNSCKASSPKATLWIRPRSCRLRTNCITYAPSSWTTGPSTTNSGVDSTAGKKEPFGITLRFSKLFPVAN